MISMCACRMMTMPFFLAVPLSFLQCIYVCMCVYYYRLLAITSRTIHICNLNIHNSQSDYIHSIRCDVMCCLLQKQQQQQQKKEIIILRRQRCSYGLKLAWKHFPTAVLLAGAVQ